MPIRPIDWRARMTRLAPLALVWFAATMSSPGGAASAATINFDFDTGSPTLSTGQGIPLDQTAGGLTAQVSSPQGSAFSIQTDGSTQFRLSQFSGHYLYDNNLNRNFLDVAFSQPIDSITLTFATADFQQVEVPTTIQLTAYRDATGTPPVGTATAHGTYGGDTMPMGTLSFHSGQPFDVVELVLPFQPQGATDFLVDNITVTTTGAATPTVTTPTPTVTAIPVCIGDCDGDRAVLVNELITLVNIALGSAASSQCPDGIPPGVSVDIALLIRAVGDALSGCPSS